MSDLHQNLVVTPATHTGHLTQNIRDGLDNAGFSESQIAGVEAALASAIHESGAEYQWLWNDRNRLARELADRTDDTATAVKAGVIAALKEAADDYRDVLYGPAWEGYENPAVEDVARWFEDRAHAIENGEVEFP